MIASMLILIDGAPAKTGAALEDGDEVDFIPLVADG
jgi:molybdopterin converting factor small subunit